MVTFFAHPLTTVASVVRVGQSYQKNGRAREGSAFSARFVCVSLSNKCVLPLLLGVLLTIGCDVGGDEAAADNRCAHRPPPTAIVIHCCTPQGIWLASAKFPGRCASAGLSKF